LIEVHASFVIVCCEGGEELLEGASFENRCWGGRI
jgi:hypothetical protein